MIDPYEPLQVSTVGAVDGRIRMRLAAHRSATAYVGVRMQCKTLTGKTSGLSHSKFSSPRHQPAAGQALEKPQL